MDTAHDTTHDTGLCNTPRARSKHESDSQDITPQELCPEVDPTQFTIGCT